MISTQQAAAFHSLFARKDEKSTSETVCERPVAGKVGGATLSIGITSQKLMLYITLGSLGLTLISASFLTWKHLHRYTVPEEQQQIVRIIGVSPFMALIGCL